MEAIRLVGFRHAVIDLESTTMNTLSRSSEMVRVENRLRELPELLATQPQFLDCVDALSNQQPVSFDSVWGSSCALLTATITRCFKNVLVVVPDARFQDRLIDDLPSFRDGAVDRLVASLSAGMSSTGTTGSSSMVVDFEFGDRLRLIKSLAAGDTNPLIVASVPSLLQPLPSPEAIKGQSRRVNVGQQMDVDGFTHWLQEQGFHETGAVALPNEFSSRGGILDVYASDWESPVRIELFDDEVESMRQFDPQTQRSIAEINQVEITVVNTAAAVDGTLADYLPDDTVVVFVEPEDLKQQAERYRERSPDAEVVFTWDEVRKSLAKFSMATAARLSAGLLDNRYSLPVDSVEAFSGDMGEVKMQVDRLTRDASGSEFDVMVLASVEGEIPRVTEILKPGVTGSDDETNRRSRNIHIGLGCIHEGFRIRGLAAGTGEGVEVAGQIVVGCDQIFNRTDLRRKSRRRMGKAIDSFSDLQVGNLIVHLSHGIGRFRGLQMLEKDGQRTEHLELEFYGGTRLYVPASKIDLVQKYIGGTKRQPVLARIGNKNWGKQKLAVEEAISDLAAEMIELQAKRELREGIACGGDSEWQHAFGQSFPYRETPDQLTAIEAIKDDMEQPRPMDRLLCGDVGFGKTEVAMRAAFKAVDNGYQVGVLVPTTVLAEQHYKSFRERMAEFPVEIGKLSRFCSPSELKETISKLKTGQVDIAIGTHRLVSKDVGFKNLGLVIIDEEQRFGVQHKERLKNLRTSVDVLTLSATPIPRTLHMSLVGVRDISNLETAPEDRSPVATKVMRYNNEIIRTAILRELNRGGQIFFVHNRVKDIHVIAQKIKELVPEVSVRIGHGQMPMEELEDVMSEFIAGKFDLLLATTIVESGLDIPNANTIFINDAENYGLSDLHQLRGRVGRYKHKAWCYLLIDPRKHLNPTAAKRLQAIETFSQMGAGFAISMRDLEIRGAGNLLGTQQSGHIATIGYELYCEMLEKAVRELRHMPKKLSISVEVDLPIEAFLPESYVSDRRQKLDVYRRLTRLENFDQIKQLKEELLDRFGPLPPPVKRLLRLSEVKLEAATWQIDSIYRLDKYLGFRFRDRSRLQQLIKERPMIRIIDDQTALVTLKEGPIKPDKMLSLVKSLLRLSS